MYGTSVLSSTVNSNIRPFWSMVRMPPVESWLTDAKMVLWETRLASRHLPAYAMDHGRDAHST